MKRKGKANIRNHHLSNLNKRNPAQAKRTIERATRREGDRECAEGEKEHNETSDDGPQEEYTPTTNPDEDTFGPLPDMIEGPVSYASVTRYRPSGTAAPCVRPWWYGLDDWR